MFKNSLGYFKFCRKIPHTNIQYVFSLQTKDYNVSKEIVSIFSLKSNPYFTYLKNCSREKIMDVMQEIREQLNQYKIQARIEYSELEKSRQAHFSIKNENGKLIDSSNSKVAKIWAKELSEYVSGEKSDREVQELGKKILKRTTIELKQCFQSLDNQEYKLRFLHKLIKVESELLWSDNERWKRRFDLDYKDEQDNTTLLMEMMTKLAAGNLPGASNSNNIATPVLNIKNKNDVVYEYLNKERVKPGFKTLKDKIIQPLTILLQSSDKDSLNEYSEDDYKTFFNTLLYTPNGIAIKKDIFEKDYDGNYVAIAEDFQNDNIDLHHYNELQIQSVSTLKEKLGEVSKFLDYCKDDKNKYIETNILQDDESFSYKHFENVAKATQERKPFEDYELKKMFNLMIEQELYKKNIDHFYIIMIALLSGMRVEEICKIDTLEIQEENKIHYFNVRGMVKSKSSVRKVPIHKILIDKFDFLKFVESRKENEKLFNLHPIKLNNRFKYSHYFLRKFSKFRDEFVSFNRIETDLISFHSFRHTFTTRLSEKSIGLMEISSILGHHIDKSQTPGYSHTSLNKNNKNLQKMYINDIKYDLEKLEKEFKGCGGVFE